MGLFRGLSPHLSASKDGSYGPGYALNAGVFDFTGVVALIENSHGQPWGPHDDISRMRARVFPSFCDIGREAGGVRIDMLAFFPSWSGKKSGLIQSRQSETPSHNQKRTSDVAQYSARH